MAVKKYSELKQDLDKLLDWFDSEESMDIDAALAKHAEAQKILDKLQAMLDKAEQKVNKV